MQQIQDIFGRVVENKKEARRIRTLYKDMLSAHEGYDDVISKIRSFKLRKSQIETAVQEQMAGEFETLDTIKRDIASDAILMSDVALAMLLKGESVEVKDEANVKYDPVFKVNFKRSR